MRGQRSTARTVWGAAGVLVLFAAGLAGGTVLSRHVFAWKTAPKPPRLSEFAGPPEEIIPRPPSTRPPIGLSPVPLEGPAAARADHGHTAEPAARIPWADPYPAHPFTLTDQDGRRVSLQDFSGKVVLVNFIYTNCKTTCPLETQELKALQGALGALMGRDVVFLSISIDPRRDTPAVLRRYAAAHGVDLRSWKFLTGPEAAVRAVLEAYRVPVRVETAAGAHEGQYELGHGNPIYFIDQWTRVRKRTAPTMLVRIGRPAIEWLVREGTGRAN